MPLLSSLWAQWLIEQHETLAMSRGSGPYSTLSHRQSANRPLHPLQRVACQVQPRIAPSRFRELLCRWVRNVVLGSPAQNSFSKRIALFMMLALYRNRVEAPWRLVEQGVWLASPVAPERCFWVAVLGADVAFGLAIDPGCSSQTTFGRRRLTSRSLWRAIRKITSPEDSIPSRSWQGNESQWLGAAGSGMLRGALEPNRKRTDVLQIQSGIQARLVFAISLLSDMAGL